jgi:hypothetical protein
MHLQIYRYEILLYFPFTSAFIVIYLKDLSGGNCSQQVTGGYEGSFVNSVNIFQIQDINCKSYGLSNRSLPTVSFTPTNPVRFC